MVKPKITVVVGTRPEAIKMAPVVAELRRHAAELATRVVVTAQHRAMLDQVLAVFGIVPDHDLDVMRPGQTIGEVTVRVLSGVEELIHRERPDLLLVQGDTTTAFAAGLAAFYQKVKLGHVEAGLRTSDKHNPFPEEINRRLLDALSDVCWAPTETSRRALLGEGIPDSRILVTGNTVIDALLAVVGREHSFGDPLLAGFDFAAGRTILVTTHRRESFGPPLTSICLALADLLDRFADLRLIFPVHPNPNVREKVFAVLGRHERALLVPPASYVDFVHLMDRADLLVTDSGGVQEEGPSLGKPVLVVRDVTERPEAVAAGTARLIGTDRARIVAEVAKLLSDPREYESMRRPVNPYGDGHAALRIVAAIRHMFGLAEAAPPPFDPAAAEAAQPLRNRAQNRSKAG